MATQAGDPRSTGAWRALREQVFAEETHCWLCGVWVNQALPRWHPLSRTVDHIHAIARGGEGVPPRHMVRLACRRCNGKRGHRDDVRKKQMSVDLSSI
jgi:5-methylcytosine-specific restriction endonuclease McrA